MTFLYFAADLSHVLLSLPSSPPASLWFRQARETRPVAVWLLTPATLARILHQVDRLEQRHAAGDYSADRIKEIRDRIRPIVDYALAHMSLTDCEHAIDHLARIGGPKTPLPQPEPLPPSPFDDLPAKPVVAPRWNGSRMRWDHASEDAP